MVNSSRIERHSLEKCPHCDSKNLKLSDTVKKTMTDIVEPGSSVEDDAKTINYRYNAPTTNQIETELNAIMQKGVKAKRDEKHREKMVKQLQKEN